MHQSNRIACLSFESAPVGPPKAKRNIAISGKWDPSVAGTAASDHSTPFEKHYENTAGFLSELGAIQ